MTQDSFDLECDRLSRMVDGAQFERLRWERSEGPMLAKLVALAHAAFEGRADFELCEEGATRDIKRFVLKIHSKRFLGMAIKVENGQAIVEAQALDRSAYPVAEGARAATDFAHADETWMNEAMQSLFSRVCSGSGQAQRDAA